MNNCSVNVTSLVVTKKFLTALYSYSISSLILFSHPFGHFTLVF